MNPVTRSIDPQLINLSGGLFDGALMTPPTEPASAAGTPIPEEADPELEALESQLKRKGKTQFRGARRVSWTVAGAMALLLVGGLAAASQVIPGVAPAPVPPPAATDAIVPASPDWLAGYAIPMEPAALVAPAEVEAAEAAIPSQPIEAPAVPQAPTARPLEPVAEFDLPPVDQKPNPIDALAAPPAFSEAAAALAIASAARAAGACIPADDVRTSMRAQVTFAPSGRVTSASLISGPFLGTSDGSCIARALRGAEVRPFTGEPTTVSTSIRIR